MEKLKTYNNQPNSLIQTRQEYSLLEKRIIYYIINELQNYQNFSINKTLFEDLEFNVNLKVLGVYNYQRIKREADNLMSRKIYPVNNDKEFHGFVLFPEVHYKSKEGIITVVLYKKAVKYLLELKQGFTNYQLKSALYLSRTTTQRLYELLSKYKDTGVWRKVDIDYLKKLLNIEGKYEKFSAFRTYVLEATKKEIESKTDINFSYELHKTGRQYSRITFYIKHIKSQPKHKKLNKPQTELKELKEKQAKCKTYLDQLGITNQDLQNKIICEKQSGFWKWLNYYNQNKEKVNNPAGHLLASLGIYAKGYK